MSQKASNRKAAAQPSLIVDSRRKLSVMDTPRIASGELGEQQFRSFIENLPVLFYVVDSRPPYTPLYVSPAFSRFGYPLQDWVTDPDIWLRVIHPEDGRWVFNQTTMSTQSGEGVDYEWRLVDASGMVHWVRDQGCLIRDKNGDVLCREGVMLDITEQKNAANALRLSEERYRNLFENANDIIYVHDLDGNYLSMNRAAESVFGYKRDEALKLHMSKIVAPDQLDLAREKLQEKLIGDTKQTAYELDCIKKDGNRITLEVNSTIITKDGKPVAVQGIARNITERKFAEDAIRESETQYRDLFENANDLIYTHDVKGNFTSLNRAGERITGYSRDEAITMNITEVVAPESLAAARAMTTRKLANEAPTTYEIDIIAKDGRRVLLELSTRLIYQNGNPVGVQGVGRDITERRRADEALKESEHRYRQLGEGISHQVWTANPGGQIDYVNSRTLEYFDRTSGEMVGEGWQKMIHPDDLDECLDRWRRSIATGEYYVTDFRLRRHDGEYRWFAARATPGRDGDGKIVKWFGTNTDIDEQRQSEAKLNYYAKHDPLTDLPNRVEFMIHLKAAIERANAHDLTKFAVLFLDLDRFKVINDSLGHIVGDKLLKQIANRLRTYVRPGDVVARLGGDEFTILLNRTGGVSDVEMVADRLQRNLSKPFVIDGYEVFTSASIGIIVSDDIMRQPEDFLRDADAAMYRAKESGKARYEIFDREMLDRNKNLLQLETDLRHAVDENQFEVLYQPIVDLEDGVVREFEALIRWRHPKNGLILPNDFIHIAEETGLIIPIGKWILGESCRQIAAWQKRSRSPLTVSVNLSAKQLMHPSLSGVVRNILDETGLRASQLRLEVTENTVMENQDRALSLLQELSSMGLSLATDDFGTGYSSLSYLQTFPFERLKIDRSFIAQMMENERSKVIVKTILMLGENLGIQVVAEGIEREDQLAILKDLGCRYGQGYLFSPPVDAATAKRQIKSLKKRFDSIPSTKYADTMPILQVAKIQ
jgi:diguanylate cyclase (GGDEF)-like protein/PAS domain S-box-containing protein